MVSGKQLRDCFISGAHAISNRREEVDALNVFPVPDGDTGTNMSMTICSALPELTALPDSCTVEQVASLTASALLRGARGNSGVILSLLFRGFSRAMQGKKEAATEDFSFAFTKGVEYAYKAVMKPTEGTILTVARVAAEQCRENLSLSPLELWKLGCDTAEKTLATTPDLLPVLKKAGVVDSGGKGYCVIINAIRDTLETGVVTKQNDAEAKPEASGVGVYNSDIDPNLANAYCTEFLVVKSDAANHPRLRAYLESVGDSVVCVDDTDIIKCHVHTSQPGKVLSEALRHGSLTRVKIENMAEQYAERQAEAHAAAEAPEVFDYVAPDNDEPYAIIAIAAGDGVRSMFNDLGVDRVVSGGQTMNPSAEDILNAIQSVSAENILVLANNKNIILSAQQAVKLADRKAVVVPTRTIPQGVSALLAFDETQPLEANLENMAGAYGAVVTGEITYASRTTEFDGKKIKENETLALVDGKLAFTAKSADAAAAKLITELCTEERSFLTVIYGDSVTDEQAGALMDSLRKKLPSDIEFTLVNGGMPVYYYYISVE